MLVATLRPAGWDVTSLPRVASSTQLGAAAKRIDPGFRTAQGAGYDGQFYWAVAVDPLARGRVHGAVDKPTYRYGHPLFGWLGWLLSAGQGGGAAGALLAAGLLSLAVATGLAAMLGGPYAALFTCCSPGLLYAAVHELGEPLALALLLGALLAYRSERRGVALACCVLLPLAKEELVLVPAALALWDLRQRRVDARWIAALLPAVAWWTYLRIHLGAWFTTGDTALAAPLAGWRRAVLDAGVGAATGGDETTIVVLVALLAVLAVAGVAALRLRSPAAVAYVLLGAVALCLAPNATVLLRDALRNTALLLAVAPFALSAPRLRGPAEAAFVRDPDDDSRHG